MLNIWKRIEEIEKLLQDEEITGYRIEINTLDKMYLLDKPEREKQNTKQKPAFTVYPLTQGRLASLPPQRSSVAEKSSD